MAKKKSAQKKSPVKDFSNSPFKSLKGLSAFEGERPEMVTSPAANQEPEKKSASVEEGSFADEMDFLGVTPLPGKSIDNDEITPEAEVGSSPVDRVQSDQDVFLNALGSMEKVFKDEWQEDEPEKKANARRMKQVERGQLKPEAELDLHGLTVEEASNKVQFFLQSAIFHGFKAVRIITGKGLHSSDGPVLRQAVERFLATRREEVVEWGRAPQRYGGEGALMVFLRERPK